MDRSLDGEGVEWCFHGVITTWRYVYEADKAEYLDMGPVEVLLLKAKERYPRAGGRSGLWIGNICFVNAVY